MRFRHGQLEIDLPDGWADQSTLAFVAPAVAPRVLTTSPVRPPTEAVQLNFVSGTDAKVVLSSQASALAEEHAFELLEEKPFSCGLGEGWIYHQRVQLGGQSIEQLVLAVEVGGAVLLASAAASTERFGHQRTVLEGVLASIGVVS